MNLNVQRGLGFAGALWLLCCVAAGAQQRSAVLMLSDLHFDPFHDPAKGAKLAAAPITQWDEILREPASGEQAEDFGTVQKTCGARGIDTDFSLLNSSLQAARKQSDGVAFVTVTGDLLAHELECRYRFAMKDQDPGGYAAFAEKTAVYVVRKVELAFPAVPVYVALGNNDSSCGDYKMDPRDRFFKGTSAAVIGGLRGATTGEVKRARQDYESGGYFAVTPPGLHKTRLLALDDIYLSDKYANCAGKSEATGADAMLGWLDRELTAAKAAGDSVWVIGHIPPGVDVYSTVRKGKSVCGGAEVKLFFGSDRLAETLEKHAGEIRLALFAHTHADEVRLLRVEGGGVPIKLVASISTVNGNRPTFTIGQVDRQTATLSDYSVYEAPASGSSGEWTPEYDFRDTYHLPDLSAVSLGSLVNEFGADRYGVKQASRAYETFFMASMPPLLELVWPEYVCALDHTAPESYKACACPAK